MKKKLYCSWSNPTDFINDLEEALAEFGLKVEGRKESSDGCTLSITDKKPKKVKK